MIVCRHNKKCSALAFLSRWGLEPFEQAASIHIRLYIIIIIYSFSFSHPFKLVFHWNLSDSKSPQVSRTLLSILAVLNSAVVWIVSTRPPIHIHFFLIMVRIRTESTRLTINGSFGEIVYAFQDRNIKRNIRTLEIKNKDAERVGKLRTSNIFSLDVNTL